MSAKSTSTHARAGLTTNGVFALAATMLRQGRLRLMPHRHWVRSLGRGRGRLWRANRADIRAALRELGQRQIAAHVVAPWNRSARHLLTIQEGYTLACYLGLPAASSLFRVEWAFRRRSIQSVVRLADKPNGALAAPRRALEHWLRTWEPSRRPLTDLEHTPQATPISARDAWRLGQRMLRQGVISRAPSLELIYKALRHARIPGVEYTARDTRGPRCVYERWIRRWAAAPPRTNLDSLSGDVLTLSMATAWAHAKRPTRAARDAPNRDAIRRAAEMGKIHLAQPREGHQHFRLDRASFEQWLRNYYARSASSLSPELR